MKNFKTFLLFILLFFFCSNTVLAQNIVPTPYQKKQLELSKKWLQTLGGYRMTMSDEVFYEKSANGKGVVELALGLAILDYPNKHSKSQCDKVFAQMKNEFNQAEKLKNATDFKLEKESKAIAEQDAIYKTDRGSIVKDIKSKFEKWNQKGEFEKDADYLKRLQVESQNMFEEICIEQIKNKIKNYSDNNNLSKELLTYNSEGEYFTVIFKINGKEWQNRINIPIAKAENFKKNWSYLRFKIDDYDWCFVENSLCPTLLKLEENKENYNYEFPSSLKNQTEIFYPFSNLDINNPYLKDYIFKYSNAKVITEQQEKQKLRLDSLEIAEYNQKLDSIFKDYNSQLLKNSHNLNKNVMSGYGKVTSKQNSKNEFSESVSYIKYNFERLNNNFEYDYEKEFQENRNLFTNKEEFDNFYNKGDKIYLVEAGKRKVFKVLKVNSAFIESMDFQKDKRESFASGFARGLLANANDGRNIPTIDYSNENKTRHNILSLINENENESFYPQILDFVIETNKSLNKEWSKNGQFFESKQAFYKAYLSEEYKAILKENKGK